MYKDIIADYDRNKEVVKMFEDGKITTKEFLVNYNALLETWRNEAINNYNLSMENEVMQETIEDNEDYEMHYHKLLEDTQIEKDEIEKFYLKVRMKVNELDPVLYDYLSNYFYDKIGRIL